MTTDSTYEATGHGEYAQVNGVNLYYETYGVGRPLILLHGGLASGEMFGPILPALSERRQVIVPDLQGHGPTADVDRPIDHRLMAADIAGLIDHLGLDRSDLVGYSLGGWAAFFTASRYPDKVGKLVMASANIRRDAIPPGPAGSGERGGNRVHERDADVPALPEGGAAPRRLRTPARQDR